MHLMIDLETMGFGPDAAICAIGAVVFDPKAGGDGLGAQRYWRIALSDSMQRGGRADAETICWWLRQTDEARSEICSPHAESLLTALPSLSDWMRLHGVTEVWGNGADFDLVILAGAYRRAHIFCPWTYPQHRCLRTLRRLRPDVAKAVGKEGLKHHALSDARWGARVAVEILRGLGQA